jgi:hypothetical protein
VARRWDVSAAASLAGDDHRAAREIARSLHDVADEVGSGMAKHLHARIPELHAPDEQSIYEETEASCTSNVDQLLDRLARGDPASAITVPQPAVEYAQGLVRRRIPLHVLLRAYRLGHAYVWDITARALREELPTEAELLASLDASSAFTFDYVDRMCADVVGAYHVERDRWRCASSTRSRATPSARWPSLLCGRACRTSSQGEGEFQTRTPAQREVVDASRSS